MMNSTLLQEIQKIEPSFIELIYKRFGLIIQVNQVQELTQTIAHVCDQFNFQPLEYLNQLKNCTSNSYLLVDLIAAITVGESYFFRDQHQIKLLEKLILPNLIEQKGKERCLKIWSAGCSTGEEIFTIAMLLSELIPIDLWDLYLLGTDINVAALKKAEEGIYGQWSMRSIPEKYMQRYFIKNNHSYILSPQIRSMVRFKYLNLCDDSYPSIINGIQEVDLILCRNVLIYFDKELVVEIMKKLSTCLHEHAYLLLGASDPIVTAETNLIFHHNEAIYFTLDNSEVTQKDF